MFLNLSQTLKANVNVNFTLLKLNFLWLSSFYCVGILEKDVIVGSRRVSQKNYRACFKLKPIEKNKK